MNIVVTGGGGFLGSRVIQLLLDRKDRGESAVDFQQVISLDLGECPVVDPRVRSVVGSIAESRLLESVITDETVGIFHLAAVLSGGSEANFDLAMDVNVGATKAILDAARKTGVTPRIVFTSSLAVFGGQMPEVVPETFATQPQSTYGAVKAIGELLVNEYSRRGFVDGRVCRLPTISVRPGTPNSAASSFASGVIREPLNGIASECPVPPETRMWLSSPDVAVENLVRAFELDGDSLGFWRTLNLPGVVVTVKQMLDSLENVGGQEARDLVTQELDEQVMDIVCSWPGEFDVERTLGFGFIQDANFDDVVRQYQAEFVDPVR